MKKVNSLLSMLALAGMVVFSGCSKDEDPAPATQSSKSVTLAINTASNPSPTVEVEVVAGSDTGVAITVQAVTTSDKDMRRMWVWKNVDNAGNQQLVFTQDLGDWSALNSGALDVPNNQKNNATVTFIVPVRTSAAAGATDVYTIWFTGTGGSATDVNDNLRAGPGKVIVKYGTGKVLNKFTDVKLISNDGGAIAQGNGKGQFLISTTGFAGGSAAVDTAGLASKVDVTYEQSGTGEAKFFSPDQKPVKGVLDGKTSITTTFKTTTLSFEDATADQINAETAGSASSIVVTNGSTYFFQTSAGVKGLIKVKALATNTNGFVTFDYIIVE